MAADNNGRTIAAYGSEAAVPPKNTGVSQTRICRGRKVASSRITRSTSVIHGRLSLAANSAAPETRTAGQEGIVCARVRVLVPRSLMLLTVIVMRP